MKVNNNGVISLKQSFSEYQPRNFPVLKLLIAPFWADVDTRENGTVWYGERSSNLHDLEHARQNVRKYFCHEDFEPNFVFVATWDKVPPFTRGSKVHDEIIIYNIYAISDFFSYYPHAQRERGKVIGVGVHIPCLWTKKNSNCTLAIDSPFQTFMVGLFID